MLLPVPPPDTAGPTAAADWVREHLGDLCHDEPAASPAFRGGQPAADAALAALDVTGYARRRSEVWPPERRGASAVSPYVRYGLLDLPALWRAVGKAPYRDRDRFRDELMWQEYARHLYARLGPRLGASLRAEPAVPDEARRAWPDPLPRDMACLDLVVGQLETDGWLVNQTRMWVASQYTVRAGRPWREGEDLFFTHLLDGSRAANRLGWQWTTGAGSGKAYGFSRWQVRKRAPGLCERCPLRDACPIEEWPPDPELPRVPAEPLLTADPDPAATGGPAEPAVTGAAEAVWLTAESLGLADPALAAHPDLPAVFVFDEPLLRRLRLSGKRLVFLAECLAAIAAVRPLEVHRGAVPDVLAGRAVATTFAPVPGWRRRAAVVAPVVVHPWRWLARPHDGSVRSYSAWRKKARVPR